METANPFSIPWMTFNRKMVWIDEEQILGGGIIAYTKAGRLWLTGEDAVSDWYLSPQEGKSAASGNTNEIILHTPQVVVLRLFIHEFLIEQQPDLFFEADSGDRQISVKIVFERWHDYSPPRTAALRTLYDSGNFAGKGVLRIPLAEILRARGYKTRYMRVTLRLELGAGTAQQVHFRAWSDSQPVLVAELSRSQSLARNKGSLPLSAVFIDENGKTLHESDGVRIIATVQCRDHEMAEIGTTGIFQARMGFSETGTYRFFLKATRTGSNASYFSETSIAVTDGKFVRHQYDEQGRHAGYVQGGRHLGFLSGSTILSEAVAALGVGTDKETLVLDARELLENTGQPTAQTGCVWMTSLNESELQEWLEHRRKCGYRFFLMANWSPEILNAGGAISPYGAELTAQIFDFCRCHEIYLKVDITHDTFARSISFPNLTQYREAGFLHDYDELVDKAQSQKTGVPGISSYPNYQVYRDDSWCRPAVRKLTEQFFRHFSLLFRDEPAIMFLSTCGEADYEIGARIVNPLGKYLRKFDQGHLLCVDLRGQLLRFRTPLMNTGNAACPFLEKHASIATVAGWGKYKNDAYAGMMLKFFGLNPHGILAEGDCFTPSWSTPYSLPFHPAEEGTRLQVRDFLWLCLINQVFVAYNWNELFMAEEHLLPSEVSQLIDWRHFQRRVPPVMLRIHESRDEDIDTLVKYEELFSRVGLDYSYVWDKDPLPGSDDLFAPPNRPTPPYVVFDIRAGNEPPDFLQSGKMPSNVKQSHIVRLDSPCYAANACISKDLDQIIVYLRNNSNYLTKVWNEKASDHWSKWSCRRSDPKSGDFKMDLVNLPPAAKTLRVYDLNTRTVVQTEKIASSWCFSRENTTHDFVIVIHKE